MRITFFISLVFTFALQADNLPWSKINKGNEYWAQQMGVAHRSPYQVHPKWIVNSENLRSDASLRLIHAVINFHISLLPTVELKKFADSLQHLMVYTSGAWPQSPDEYNRAGWWGISYPVALRYGLQVNGAVDERFDFEKSTRVALKYIKDLQRQFPNRGWMAAFAVSPVAATRNIDYFQDSVAYQLLALKKLMAASPSMEAEQHAVNYYYKDSEVFRTKHVILAELIIEKTGMPKSVLYGMNPWLIGNEIPAKTSLKLPPLAYEIIKKVEDDVVLLSQARIEERSKPMPPKPEETSVKTVYLVKSGDNLSLIAQRNSVSVAELKRWNKLKSDVIFAGQKLVLYDLENQMKTKEAPLASTNNPTQKFSLPASDVIEYRVKSGDTLWSIARQFPGVSPDNIMTWNGIDANIKKGQKLKILKSEIRN